MTISLRFLLSGTAWTVGTYGVNQGIRLLTNIILARLLAPELFGIMLIVYSLRTGVELLSDVGIGQNIVYHKNADDPDFYNTAWSLQIVRGVILWLVFLAAATPVASFYRTPILNFVVPVTAFGFLLTGLTSVSKPFVQKRMQIWKLSGFETIITVIGSTAHIGLAYMSPTIWALVFGSLIASTAAMIGSYFLLPDIKHRFYISKQYCWQIIGFGKWIFLSSMVSFLSTYIDRLYLGKFVPLELLGIYGIARSLSDLSGNLVLRLGNVVLFPFIASHSHVPRSELRAQLAPIRARFLLLAALGLSVFVTVADLVIKLLYDQRYQAAAWILPILVIGSWFSVLSTVNESTLLGIGKPSYNAISHSLKLAFLFIGLSLTVKPYGLIAGVLVVALADLCAYVPILIGQVRERFSFGTQDLLMTIVVAVLIGLLEWLRWLMGFGTSLETVPLQLPFFGSGR